jgi:hypothetical protein
MMAVVKKIGVKTGFQVPTIEEIQEYLIEKKAEWPAKFIEYYSEKFWSFYQSNGWKVSGKAAMKDWRAAFTSQWQRPKFKEDIEFLNQCMKERKPAIVKDMNGNDRLNNLLLQYRQNFETVPDEKLVKVYDYLKEHKMIRLTPEEKKYIVAAYGDNVEKGKAACVKTMFTNMINNGIRF